MAKKGEKRPWKVIFQWAGQPQHKMSFTNEDVANSTADSIRAHAANSDDGSVTVTVRYEPSPTPRTATPSAPRSADADDNLPWKLHYSWPAGDKGTQAYPGPRGTKAYRDKASAQIDAQNLREGAAFNDIKVTVAIAYEPGRNH